MFFSDFWPFWFFMKTIRIKNVYKESILVAALSLCANAWIAKLTMGPVITAYMINNIQEKLVYSRLYNDRRRIPTLSNNTWKFVTTNNRWLLAVNYYRKNLFPSKIFDWVLNARLMTTSLALSSKNYMFHFHTPLIFINILLIFK